MCMSSNGKTVGSESKMLLIFIISVHIIFIAQAQRAGIKGGFNVSKLYANEVANENNFYGFNVGIYTQVLQSRALALQLELLYTTKGTKADNEASPQSAKYNLSYLELPVLAAIRLGGAGEVHVGAYASYLLNAKIAYSSILPNGFTKITDTDLKSFDYGLIAGLGVNVGNAQVGVRYNLGLASIANTNNAVLILGSSRIISASIYVSLSLFR